MSLRFALAVFACAAGFMPAVPVLAEDLTVAAQSYTVEDGDNLAAIARKFDIGGVELLAANPSITSSTLKTGDTLMIPKAHVAPSGVPHTGIIINLSALRLFYYGPDGKAVTFPISAGREGWSTPTGTTKIVRKRENPDWTVPASIRAQDPKLPAVVPAGPKNPLGQFAMSLGWPGYAIHGTNAPSSIGKPASHGCLRMYPEDIETLFGMVDVGTPVTVVDEPFVIEHDNGDIYLQAMPSLAQAHDIASYKTPQTLDLADPRLAKVNSELAQLKAQGADIDQDKVNDTISRHDGIPVIIGHDKAGG
ncbi:MAG: L,D-transpeptidase family protein [Asticcacaulis sp.]